MSRYPMLLSALLAGVCLSGCQALADALKIQTGPSPSPAPKYWMREVLAVAPIGHLQAPATATVSEAMTIEYWAFVGTNGCSGLSTPSLEINEASRTVTVQAISSHLVGEGFACSANYPGFQPATVSFTPKATGTYTVVGEPYQAIPPSEQPKLGPGVTPVATLAIDVVASGSVLSEGD